MWLFLRRRLILWAMLAIAVPLLDWLLGKAAAELRARKGDMDGRSQDDEMNK